MAHAVRHAYLLEHLFGQAAAFLGGDLTVEQRQFHVVQHVERVDQMERLEDEAQCLVAEGCQFLVLHALHTCTGYLDGAAGGRVEQAHDVEQGRLAAARGAHDAEELTLRNGEVHIFQRLCFNLVCTVNLVDTS